MQPAASPPLEDDARTTRRFVVTLMAVGGGILILGALYAAAFPLRESWIVYFSATMIGAIVFFVGAILGAVSPKFSAGARAGFGLGAGLAGLLLLFTLAVGPAAASDTTCGAIAAGPGLFALRSFTMLRDAWT